MSVPIDPILPVVDMSAGVEPSTSRGETPTADMLPYVLPMFAYVTLGGLESATCPRLTAIQARSGIPLLTASGP